MDIGSTLSKKGQPSKVISKKESIEVPEVGSYASSFNNSNPDFPSFAETSGAKKSSVMTKGKKQKGRVMQILLNLVDFELAYCDIFCY